jgi:predicted transcriptional regulator
MCKQNEMILLKELNKLGKSPSTTKLQHICGFNYHQTKSYLSNLKDKGYVVSKKNMRFTYWNITKKGDMLLK